MPTIYMEGDLEITYAPHEILSDDDLAARNLSRDAYKEIRAERVERERHAPKVGETAPDFEVEMLSADGKRTGQMFRLSGQSGRPVALIFGSYT